jgi:branched-chain amino acid transport system substrate-binding protein
MSEKKKDENLGENSMDRRDFMKRSAVLTAGALGASLFSPLGTPFLFAKSQEPIKVGYCEVLSGLFGSLGTAEIMGAKLAEKHINEQGGIMGRPLKVIYEDTQCKAQDAARVAKRLILEEGVVALHGETCTPVTKVLSEVAKQYGVVHFDYEVDGVSVYSAMHKLAFRLGDDGPTQMRGIVRLAEIKYPNFKKWAVLVPDYAWGHDCLKDFQDGLADSKLKDGEIKPFIHKFGEADFSSPIQQISDYKPDGLVTISWAGDMITFLRQQKPYELLKKSVGFHYGNSVGLAKALGNEMEPLWSGMDQGHPSLPPGKKFNDMFVKEYGEWVSEDTSACYYDSLFILKKAIEKAKSDKPEDIAKAMEGLEYDGCAGWVQVRPVSHLPMKKAYYMGYIGPQAGAPYWMATEVVELPYEKVMISDEEAKTKFGLPIPFTS